MKLLLSPAKSQNFTIYATYHNTSDEIREISRNRSIMRGIAQSSSAASATALLVLLSLSSATEATEFDAGVVMERMDAHQRGWYVQGVIEGLAFARYKRDNQHLEGDAKTVAGMKCIYDWFYEKPNTLQVIYAAFDRFPTYTPATIISTLVEQSCPE